MVLATGQGPSIPKIVFSSLVVLLLVGSPALAGDRTPPSALDKMPTDFRQTAENLRKGKWKESLEHLGRIEEAFQEMSLALEKVVTIAAMDEVSFALEDLRTSIKEKDPAKAEASFLRFEKKYLDVCERFDFQIPPVLQLMQLDFEAATRLQTEKDLAPVVKNLTDAYEILPWLEEAMGRIVSDGAKLRLFRTAVRESKAAAERGDREKLAASIHEALTQIPDFIFRSLKAATPGNGNK